jgi:hypothetical protein
LSSGFRRTLMSRESPTCSKYGSGGGASFMLSIAFSFAAGGKFSAVEQPEIVSAAVHNKEREIELNFFKGLAFHIFYIRVWY